MARERVAFQGLPARICWLGQGERAQFGLALKRIGEERRAVRADRDWADHLDTGSVASPFRETKP